MGYSGTVPDLPTLGARALGGNRFAVLLPILAAIGAGVVAAVVATTQDPLVAVLLAGGLALVLLSVRWPLLSLFVFVALIPIEETVSIAGVGTLSRWVGIAFAGVYLFTRLGKVAPGALPVAGWAYAGWAVFSLAWARDPDVTSGQLQTLLQLVVIAFLIADVVIHNPAVVRPLLWVYSLSAASTAALGIILYLVGGVGADGRAAAIQGQNPAQFATLLLPALIFGLYELLERRRIVAAAAVTTLCAGAIALSGTRSVWLAATVVIFFMLLPRLGVRRAATALVVIAAIALVVLQIPGVGALVAERTGTAASTGGAGRTDIWSVGLRIFESAPIIGVGYANFPVAFTLAVVRAADVGIGIGAGSGPHNIVIGTGGELGIVGLALLALFLLPLVIRRGWGPDGLVVQAILASLMIDALFVDIISNRKQVWVVIGLAAGLAYLRLRERRTAATTAEVPVRITPTAEPLDRPPPKARPRGASQGSA